MEFNFKTLMEEHSKLNEYLQELDEYIDGSQRKESNLKKRFEELEPYAYEQCLKFYATVGKYEFCAEGYLYCPSVDELVYAVNDVLERFENESFEVYSDWRQAAEDYLGPDLNEYVMQFIKWDEVIRGLKDKTLCSDYHELFDGTVLLFL